MEGKLLSTESRVDKILHAGEISSLTDLMTVLTYINSVFWQYMVLMVLYEFQNKSV
jgi:hypothetical protein